jgi:hypothetical protein
LAVLALPDRVEREFDARQEGAVLIEGAKALRWSALAIFTIIDRKACRGLQ